LIDEVGWLPEEDKENIFEDNAGGIHAVQRQLILNRTKVLQQRVGNRTKVRQERVQNRTIFKAKQGQDRA
jgi:hypothetical protein